MAGALRVNGSVRSLARWVSYGVKTVFGSPSRPYARGGLLVLIGTTGVNPDHAEGGECCGDDRRCPAHQEGGVEAAAQGVQGEIVRRGSGGAERQAVHGDGASGLGDLVSRCRLAGRQICGGQVGRERPMRTNPEVRSHDAATRCRSRETTGMNRKAGPCRSRKGIATRIGSWCCTGQDGRTVGLDRAGRPGTGLCENTRRRLQRRLRGPGSGAPAFPSQGEQQ